MLFHISLSKLKEFTEDFWSYVKEAKVFAIHGEMGSGKTTIIEALCRQKGVKTSMGSPTFSIINEYAYTETEIEKRIYHIDLYRLKDEKEVIDAGVEDCIYSNEICFVEWPQKASRLFDENTVHVFIEVITETERELKI